MCETMVGKVALDGSAGWVDSSNQTCPTCRSKVQKVTDDFRANNLLEIYLKMNPSKSRSTEETAELDAEYKRGDAVSHLCDFTLTDMDRSKLAFKTITMTTILVMKTMNQHILPLLCITNPVRLVFRATRT